MATLTEPRVEIGGRFYRLSFAALCLSDETVFDMRDRVCPVCGSETWHPLAAWLRENRGRR
jgi:hypothetical protein